MVLAPIFAAMEKNYLKKSFISILLVLVFLLSFQFLSPHITFFKDFRNFNFFVSYLNDYNDSSTIDSDTNLLDLSDTLLTANLDTINRTDSIVFIDSTKLLAADTSQHLPLYENTHALAHFFKALKTKKKVRVAYYGDSQIEGDLITKELREKFQDNFGGEGVGFVGITSITAGFRQTITHTFSNNWKYVSMVNTKSSGAGLGISGERFSVISDSISNSASINISASKSYKRYKGLNSLYLYYGKTEKPFKISFESDGKSFDKELKDTLAVNRTLISNQNLEKIKIKIKANSNQHFYGLSSESDSGVIIDNFSSRGNSGLALASINSEILKSFNKWMDYDLIVFQFGINVTNANMKDYNWYYKAFLKVIEHYKKNFPNTSILIIGLADRGYKNVDEIITNPSIPLILKSQYKTAISADVSFYNLFEAMGSYNSMKVWADKKPPLANKDYTHFNHRGGATVAGYLFEFLNNQYQLYYQNAQKNP